MSEQEAAELIEQAKVAALDGPPFRNPFDVLRSVVAARLAERDAFFQEWQTKLNNSFAEELQAVEDRWKDRLKKSTEANQSVRAQLAAAVAKSRAVLQKAAGVSPTRCVCVFDSPDGPPLTECGYHQELRAELEIGANTIRQWIEKATELKARIKELENGTDRRLILAERYGARSACDALQKELNAAEERCKALEANLEEIHVRASLAECLDCERAWSNVAAIAAEQAKEQS